MNKRILLFIFLLSCQILNLSAQTEDQYIIKKRLLSLEEGLSSREVFSSVEDKNGFMWFGTSKGLNRFDGKSFKVFTKENFGLLDNEISQLSIDESNRLYILYYSEENRKLPQLEILDLNTYTLHKLDEIFPVLPFNLKDVVFVTNDNNNQINIITIHPYRLWKLDASKHFTLVVEMKNWYNLTKENINYPFVLSNTLLNDELSIIQNKNYPLKYIKTKDKTFDISTKEQIVYLKANQIKLLDENINGIGQKKTISSQFKKIVGVKTNNKGEDNYLLCTVEKDIKIAQIQKEFFRFSHNNEDINLLTDNTIIKLYTKSELDQLPKFGITSHYIDSRGILWLTSNIGIFQIAYKKDVFFKYYKDVSGKLQLFSNQVRGIWADSFDIGNKKHNIFLASIWEKLVVKQDNTLSSFATSGLATDIIHHKNSFYIASAELLQYNPEKLSFTKFFNPQGQFINLWSLFSSTDSTILLGCEKNLFVFNDNTKQFKTLQYKSNSIPQIINGYRFVRSRNYGIVVAAENGVYFLDSNHTIIDYYGIEAKDASHKLPINGIYDILEDKNGICWIASVGQGLFRWDWNSGVGREVKKINNFKNNENISSNILYRMEEDDEKNLWISTYIGLMYFNTTDYTKHIFTVNDGLTNNEFNRVSSFKAVDGKMFFGGVNGINAFYPKEVKKMISTIDYPLKASRIIKYDGKKNVLVEMYQKNLEASNKVIMEPSDTYISIDFSLLDFEDRITNYAYKIEGVTKEWQPTTINNVLLSQLPFGKFQLRIKAQQSNGAWNPSELIIPLIVAPPFYLTTWFKILSAMLMFSFFYFLFYARNLLLRLEKKKLASLVKERTQDLSIALEDKSILLSEIHHRVKNNLQTVTQLLHMQSELITPENIQHSFKVSESRIKSIALIHEKLYQNQNVSQIEINLFVQEIILEVSNIFKNEQSAIQFNHGGTEILLSIKTAVPLGLILNELITNSYKYLPHQKTGNTVGIHWEQQTQGYCTLIYKDNGPGLPDGIDLHTAKGMGLKLVKGLSKQLGGDALYSFDSGSTFTVHFLL